MASPEGTKILATIGHNKSPIVIALDKYKKVENVDIRKHFYDKKKGEFHPTRKGITLTSKTFSLVLNALKQNETIINKWLTSVDETPEISTRDNAKEETARESAKYKDLEFRTKIKEKHSPDFISFETRGGLHEITYNKNHPFYQAYNEMITSIEDGRKSGEKSLRATELIDILLVTFFRSIYIFEKVPILHPDILMDTLVFNWGHFLERYLTTEKKDDLEVSE